jgi:hypothetical protein
VVQFHPSLAYEDFVRGWRPAGDGRLSLVDGIMMQASQAGASEPDQPFVLVIEEINRRNPAQIFEEMLRPSICATSVTPSPSGVGDKAGHAVTFFAEAALP